MYTIYYIYYNRLNFGGISHVNGFFLITRNEIVAQKFVHALENLFRLKVIEIITYLTRKNPTRNIEFALSDT